jgi:transposase
MAYSMEFRIAVANAYEACGSSAEVATEHGCSESWVRRLMQRERETGSLAPKPAVLPDNNKLDEAEMKHLAELIAAKPDMTLSELAAELSNKVSPPTVLRARRRLGLTRKKSRFMPQNKIVPT